MRYDHWRVRKALVCLSGEHGYCFVSKCECECHSAEEYSSHSELEEVVCLNPTFTREESIGTIGQEFWVMSFRTPRDEKLYELVEKVVAHSGHDFSIEEVTALSKAIHKQKMEQILWDEHWFAENFKKFIKSEKTVR